MPMLLKKLSSVISRLKVTKEIHGNKKFTLQELEQHINHFYSLSKELLEVEKLEVFQCKSDEVNYYKYEKPKFFKYGVYLKELYEIELNEPPGFPEDRKKYLKKKMKDLKSFYNMHKEYFIYYKSNDINRDNEIFSRDSLNRDIFTLIESTKMLEKYLSTQSDPRSIEEKVGEMPKSVWKGSIIEAVELLYALAFANKIEHESQAMKELVKDFELMFNVKLHNHYRKFLDIRKRYEPTKFLEHLRDVLKKSVEQMNEEEDSRKTRKLRRVNKDA